MQEKECKDLTDNTVENVNDTHDRTTFGFLKLTIFIHSMRVFIFILSYSTTTNLNVGFRATINLSNSDIATNRIFQIFVELFAKFRKYTIC